MIHTHGCETISSNLGIPKWAQLITSILIHPDPSNNIRSIEIYLISSVTSPLGL